MFSKQHYELLARSFRQELDRGSVDDTGRGWLEMMARILAVDLQSDNHRFSTSRFLAACGVREYVTPAPSRLTRSSDGKGYVMPDNAVRNSMR